jgi:hypothetical protein
MPKVAVGPYRLHECGRQVVGHFEIWEMSVDGEFCIRKCQHNFSNFVQNRTAQDPMEG